MAVSASRPTAPTSSTSSDAGPPIANATTKIARSRMLKVGSSSGITLSGDASARYDFQKNLQAAETKLHEGDNASAHRMYHEIRARIEKTHLPTTSFFPARCLLGLAYSSTTDKDKTDYALKAYAALSRVCGSKIHWSKNEISPGHSELRWHFQLLKFIIPRENDFILTNIGASIEECAKHILPIDDFYEKIKHGDRFFKINDTTTARELYKMALQCIEGLNGIEFAVARITRLIKLTCTYKDDPNQTQFRAQTQDGIFELFEQGVTLYEKGKYTRVEAYTLLIRFLRDLHRLTPETDSVNRREIQIRINGCRHEIAQEARRAAASTPAELMPPPPSDKKVAPGAPEESWDLTRLFITIVCMAALGAASIVLYRRYTNFSK